VIEHIEANVRDITDIPTVQAVVEQMPQLAREHFLQVYRIQRTIRLANALGHSHKVSRDVETGVVTVTVRIPPVRDAAPHEPCNV
jgi:hypothetical protein